MIKLKDLLKESTWANRKFGEPLPTMADYKKAYESKTEEKITEMKVNKGKVDKTYKSVLNHMRKVIKKLNDDEMYEVTTQLKKWFNKNIY